MTQAWQDRIDKGQNHHGLGSGDYLPGNVQHLVSPLVGTLRRVQAGQTTLDTDGLEYMIDRLTFVLEIAREEDENNRKEGTR